MSGVKLSRQASSRVSFLFRGWAHLSSMAHHATNARSLFSLTPEILLHTTPTGAARGGTRRSELYELLRWFPLVNSTWRELAQKEMLVHLTVRKGDQLHWSQHRAFDRYGASGDRRLDVEFTLNANFKRVLALLERCRKLCQDIRMRCGRSLGDDHKGQLVYERLQAMPSKIVLCTVQYVAPC